jgi:hypothetical protein
MAGVQIMTGTHGIPLEVVLGLFKDQGLVVDWPDYILGAIKDGANPKNVRAKIVSAVGEIYGPVYLTEFEKRLASFL